MTIRLDASAIDAAKKGSADLVILALVEDEPLHGYEIAGRIERGSDGTFRFTLASLYATLYRLESATWCGALDRARGQRRRRCYRITDKGRRRSPRSATTGAVSFAALTQLAGLHSAEAGMTSRSIAVRDPGSRVTSGVVLPSAALEEIADIRRHIYRRDRRRLCPVGGTRSRTRGARGIDHDILRGAPSKTDPSRATADVEARAHAAGGTSLNLAAAVRLAVRQMRLHPGFAAVTILVLALGIGRAPPCSRWSIPCCCVLAL
jgi:DNA-binding PadR family transcriptional regulator